MWTSTCEIFTLKWSYKDTLICSKISHLMNIVPGPRWVWIIVSSPAEDEFLFLCSLKPFEEHPTRRVFIMYVPWYNYWIPYYLVDCRSAEINKDTYCWDIHTCGYLYVTSHDAIIDWMKTPLINGKTSSYTLGCRVRDSTRVLASVYRWNCFLEENSIDSLLCISLMGSF